MSKKENKESYKEGIFFAKCLFLMNNTVTKILDNEYKFKENAIMTTFKKKYNKPLTKSTERGFSLFYQNTPMYRVEFYIFRNEILIAFEMKNHNIQIFDSTNFYYKNKCLRKKGIRKGVRLF